MKKLQDFNFKDKNVLIRCDFNVPFSQEGKVLDDFRIQKAVPTLKYLIEKKAKLILLSHLEAKGKKNTLKIIIPKLEELLGLKVTFLSDYLGEDTKTKIDKLKPGQAVLLENLRFYKEEKENDKEFAKRLSKLGDIFINEAFSSCHRAHASISGIPKYLPSGAGFLLEKEVKVFSDLLRKPEPPFLAIIGGIKLETKIKTILNILKIADYLILGSKIGEVFYAKNGLLPGRDFPEEKLIEGIDFSNPKIYLPKDAVICLKTLEDKYLRNGIVESLKKEEEIFDIGPESIKIFKEIIKKAKTVLWNGSMGMHEDKRFEKGTKEVAIAISQNNTAFRVAGGGETVSAIREFGLNKGFDFLSTGGGAMLEFLAGEKLPGLESLENH